MIPPGMPRWLHRHLRRVTLTAAEAIKRGGDVVVVELMEASKPPVVVANRGLTFDELASLGLKVDRVFRRNIERQRKRGVPILLRVPGATYGFVGRL